MDKHVESRIRERSPQKAKILEMLKRMLRIRLFQEEIFRRHLTSNSGTSDCWCGQEGMIVGACMALSEYDYMRECYRSDALLIGTGTALEPLMTERFKAKVDVGTRERTVCQRDCGSRVPTEWEVVSGLMVAAISVALGAALRATGQVCLCFVGDGAEKCAPFQETLSLSAFCRLPIVFLCASEARASVTTAISDLGATYGIPSIAVDGCDVLTVYGVVSWSVERAREHGGPSLLGVETYRTCHDQKHGLRKPESLSEEKLPISRLKDPLDLFAARLCDTGELAAEELESTIGIIQSEIQAAVAFAQRSPDAESEEPFKEPCV